MDNNLVKAKNDESGVLTAQLDDSEVTTIYLDPVPQYAPGVLVMDPGTATEEHIFFRERDSVGGTVSGLVRDITTLNGGSGRTHINGTSYETMQVTEYINYIVEVLQRGWQAEMQTVTYGSATTFVVAGNQASRYTFGRLVRYDENDAKIGFVASSSYNAGNDETTVTVRGFSVPNPLASVEFLTAQAKGFTSDLPVFYGEDTASDDDYLVEVLPEIGAYFPGMIIIFKAATANTGAATLNISSLGAKTIKKLHDQDLETGDIEANQLVFVMYDGTNFELLSGIAQKPVASNLELTEAPADDHTANGIKETLTAGDNLVFGDVCYMGSDGKMEKADADAIATASAIAMALGTINEDATGSFLLLGVARDDTWAWTVGGLIFLSTTAGAMTQTQPTGEDDVVQVLGKATHADRMYFHPELLQIEHAA